MEKDFSEETGKTAATLAAVEIGLGSVLHSFKIPLSGHVLSINQMALLARACFRLQHKKAALEISLVTSLLKSLSPAGKKLTPMLAIAAQGLLFYAGLVLGGLTIPGLLAATVFSALWAFVQPVLFIYLLFGQSSLEVVSYFLKELNKLIPQAEKNLLVLIIVFIALKMILAFAACLFALKAKEETFEKFKLRMTRDLELKARASDLSPAKAALRDLFNPLFIISLALTAFYFIYSEASFARLIWELLRPVAAGFIVFYVFRIVPLEQISAILEKRGWIHLSKSLNKAIGYLKDIRFVR